LKSKSQLESEAIGDGISLPATRNGSRIFLNPLKLTMTLTMTSYANSSNVFSNLLRHCQAESKSAIVF